jgi:hypothetical protein
MLHPVLAALSWNPQVKGALIVLTAVLILCGSVYLILSTNTGARLGFLIAAAGLAGWMAVMGIVWTVYGIGLKGTAPAWVILAVEQGDVGRATEAVLAGFPKGWKPLKLDSPETAEAQAAADVVLAPPPSEGKKGIFKSSTDYAPVAAYERGGEKYFFTLRHRPHYLVLQVQAVVRTITPGQPPVVRSDPSAPVVSILVERNLGSLRKPPAVVMVSSLLLFGLLAWVLHERDKEIVRAREGVDN